MYYHMCPSCGNKQKSKAKRVKCHNCGRTYKARSHRCSPPQPKSDGVFQKASDLER